MTLREKLGNCPVGICGDQAWTCSFCKTRLEGARVALKMVGCRYSRECDIERYGAAEACQRCRLLAEVTP